MEVKFIQYFMEPQIAVPVNGPRKERRGARPNINKASARLVGKILAFLRYPLS